MWPYSLDFETQCRLHTWTEKKTDLRPLSFFWPGKHWYRKAIGSRWDQQKASVLVDHIYSMTTTPIYQRSLLHDGWNNNSQRLWRSQGWNKCQVVLSNCKQSMSTLRPGVWICGRNRMWQKSLFITWTEWKVCRIWKSLDTKRIRRV